MFDLETFRHVYLRRVVGTVAGAIGPDATARVAQILGQGVFGLNTLARRRAEARVMAALGSSCTPGQARSVVRGMYANWSRFWAEALFIQRLLRDTSWRQFVSLDHNAEALVSEANAAGHGCIFAAGYFGNPAVLADVIGRFIQPVHVVVDYLAQPELRRWQAQLYARPHVRPIDRRHAASEIPRVLAGGGAVLLIAEHERRRGRAVACDYLGSRIAAYPTIPRLARAFGAPVGVVSCRRNDEGFGFRLSVHDWIPPAAMHDEVAAMRRILGHLEAAALASPEQYLWSVPIGVPLTQMAAGEVSSGLQSPAMSPGLQAGRSSQTGRLFASSALPSAAGIDHWNGNRIGVVPKKTSNNVGVAMAVSGGHITAGGGSIGGN